MMLAKNHALLLAFLAIAQVSFSCSKEKTGQQEKIENTSGEVEQHQFEITTNYDSLMTVIIDITARIAADPSNISLRKALVAACYDSSIDRIIAPGIGKPVQNAQTPSVAKDFAVRAAKIEAYRWAYVIKQWHLNPAQQRSDIQNVEIPPARVVAQKTLPDSSVLVLVVLNASKVN